MHESETDLARLQELLDANYALAGRHLLSIHTPERRLNARQVADRLSGMCLLTLATVTADGRPIVGPVDGTFCFSNPGPCMPGSTPSACSPSPYRCAEASSTRE